MTAYSTAVGPSSLTRKVLTLAANFFIGIFFLCVPRQEQPLTRRAVKDTTEYPPVQADKIEHDSRNRRGRPSRSRQQKTACQSWLSTARHRPRADIQNLAPFLRWSNFRRSDCEWKSSCTQVFHVTRRIYVRRPRVTCCTNATRPAAVEANAFVIQTCVDTLVLSRVLLVALLVACSGRQIPHVQDVRPNQCWLSIAHLSSFPSLKSRTGSRDRVGSSHPTLCAAPLCRESQTDSRRSPGHDCRTATTQCCEKCCARRIFNRQANQSRNALDEYIT